jgi:polysaccharide biosynthesis/export protein
MVSTMRCGIYSFLAIILLGTVGCSSGGGFSLFPSGTYLTHQAREVVNASPRVAALPRELDRSVLPAHFLQPGDVVVIEPVRLEANIRLPADQRVMADGTVDLGGFGRAIVAGMTIEDAEQLIEQRIAELGSERIPIHVRLVEPQQVYYVLGEVNSPGAFPLVGSETVLDAILAAGGLTGRASTCDLMLVRPTPPPSCRVTLPVCYQAITQLGDTSTNYQLQPGDRVFVATRTMVEDLAFWRARKTCSRCEGLQCPCPGAEWVVYQNPLSEYFPEGRFPRPTEVDDSTLGPEQMPYGAAPEARPSIPTPLPTTDGAPAPPSQDTWPAPRPTRPDPFEGDDFFERRN